MNITELNVHINGPIWELFEFEIEGIPVMGRVETDGDKRSVTVNNFTVSADNILNVFTKVGAPNGTAFTIEIEGEASNGDALHYKENARVVRNGTLRTEINKSLDELHSN